MSLPAPSSKPAWVHGVAGRVHIGLQAGLQGCRLGAQVAGWLHRVAGWVNRVAGWARLVEDAPQPLRRAPAEAANTAREVCVVDGERRRLEGRRLEATPIELPHTLVGVRLKSLGLGLGLGVL